MRFLLSLVATTAALAAAQDFGDGTDNFDTEFEDFGDSTFDTSVDAPAPGLVGAPAPAPQQYASYGSGGGGGGYYPPTPPPPTPTLRPTTITPVPPTTIRPPPPNTVTTTVRPTVPATPDPCPNPTPCPVCPPQSSCPTPPAPTPCLDPKPAPAPGPSCPPGALCADHNECEEGTHNCHELAKCTNTKGSFTCRCDYGTQGDGITCTGPATCGANQCDARGMDYACCTEISRNNEGIRQINNPPVCMCSVGLRGNGANCTGTDVCASVARYNPIPFNPARITSLPAGQCFQGSTCTRVGVGNAYVCTNPANCPKWQLGRTEVGSQWVTVKFSKVFADIPVVVAGPPTSRENDAVTVLISKVDTTGFQVKLQEPSNCGDGVHIAERITWLAVLPNEVITVGGNNIYVTAGSQIVPMNSDIPVRQNTQLPNAAWVVAQVQDSADGEITATYTGYTAATISIQVAAAATRRSQAVVGYVAFHGISLTNWYLHPTQRYNQFVGADCDNTPHLFFLGEDLSVPYENQFRPISGYWCIAPRNPWVIAGWSRFNGAPLILRSFTAAQRGPGQSVPTIPFTNFRIQRFRTSNIQVRAEAANCNSLDDVYSTISTATIGTTFASAFHYVAILPGYSSCCVRNPYVPAPTPPASSH